jgi:hypothetical protein
VRESGRLVQGGRTRRAMKNWNNEPKKLMKSGDECAPASVVPAGRTCFGLGFPGTSSLANFHCRFATKADRDEKAGKAGKKEFWIWEKPVRKRGFFPDGGCFSRLFPCFPGFSHLFPHQFLLVKRTKRRLEPSGHGFGKDRLGRAGLQRRC